MAPAGRVLESDRPDYQTVELDRPELYFSPSLAGYAVAGTDAERARRAATTTAVRRHGRRADVVVRAPGRVRPGLPRLQRARLGRDRRRLADAVGAQRPRPARRSWRRSCPTTATRTRSSSTARVQWVVDAYTSTSRYPYAERIGNDVQLSHDSGLPRDANYVRNSVKAVVDAYDGSVTLLRHRRRATRSSRRGSRVRRPVHAGRRDARRAARAPALPRGPVPGADRTCTRSTSSTPEHFFEREGAWSVAQAPSVDPRGARRVETPPQATAPTDDRDARRAGLGVVERPLHPVLHDVRTPARAASSCCCGRSCRSPATTQRTELQAYMTASSDPDDVRPADRVRRRRAAAACPTGRARSPTRSTPTRRSAQQITLQNQRRRHPGSLRRPPARRRSATGCCGSGRSTSAVAQDGGVESRR